MLAAATLLVWSLAGAVAGLASSPGKPMLDGFLTAHCVECHDGDVKKGGLDLTALKPDFKAPDNSQLAVWTKVQDRVANGEMPPLKKPRPGAADLRSFTNTLGRALLSADRAVVAREGRASERRLNRHEYEETLRDLLELPYLEVKAFLPEDREANGFNKTGEALDVSHVQMARYLSAAEFALRQAVAPQATRPETATNRFYTWEEPEFFGKIDLEGPLNRRTFPLIGLDLQRDVMAEKNRKMPHTTDPGRREKESMVLVVSTYEPTEIRYGRFRAPVSGRYRLTFSGYSVRMAADYKSVARADRMEPVCIYAETPPRSLRKVGDFDVNPDPTVCSLDVWLLAGETIRPDAARLFRSRPPNHQNPMTGPDGMPGVAFQWMEVQGPLIEQWPPASHQKLFGNLPLTNRTESAEAPAGGRRKFRPPPGVDVISSQPDVDAARLLRVFMKECYRRPVEEADVSRFLGLIGNSMKAGYSFSEAMIAGYTAVLCSPGFLYLNEAPGRLDDRALAERLSYFLWNSRPDAELIASAEAGRLHRPGELKRQTDRMLADPRARRFVDGFLDYWLDLRFISGSAPDEELYPDYQLDDLLAESMTEETQAFFAELLRRDLPSKSVVDTSFAMLNERMATHYGIPGVAGVKVRPVDLGTNHVRGGLLTQASVLKVTANGTSTSPVKRGAWIMSRIVGQPPPPPPASVPAVDPDIRGATTIREQLAKHRTQEACNACHRKIDPAGFALESFDVMGAWRDRYRSVGKGEPVKGIGHNGNNFHFNLGQTVDPSGDLPTGETFADVRQLKLCLAKDDRQLARNLVRQMTVYATGAPIRYSDRPLVEKILARSRASDYGVRTLLHELVQSDLFLNK